MSRRRSGPARPDRRPPTDARSVGDPARRDGTGPTFLEEPVDARGYLDILWRSRLLLALLIIGSAVTAYGLSLLVQPSYQSTARVLIDTSADPLAPSDAESAMRQLATAQRLATTSGILAAAARQVPGESERALKKKVTVTADPDANLLNVTASDHEPDRAATIANAVATSFITNQRASVGENLSRARAILRSRLESLGSSSATELERRALTEELSSLELRAATANVQFRVAEPAEPADEPSSPHPFRNALAAFFAATVIGVLFVLGRAQLSSAFTDARELSRFIGVPIFARVSPWPSANGSSEGRAVALENAAFSSFRGRVERMLGSAQAHIILVTSPMSSASTAAVSAAFARSLAETDRPTLLVLAEHRADPLNSSRDLSLALGNVSGETGTTGNASSSRRADISTAVENGPVASTVNASLFIDTGPRPGDELGNLRNEDVHAFVTAVKRKYAYVVIDAPPLLATNDALMFGGATDEIVLVIEPEVATRALMLDTRDVLQEIGTPVLGLVLIESDANRLERKPWRRRLRRPRENAQTAESQLRSSNGVSHRWWAEARGRPEIGSSASRPQEDSHPTDPIQPA